MDLHVDTTTPTLDRNRTDDLRTFLTVEAAADLAATDLAAPAPSFGGRRRLLGGLAATVLLAAGLFAVNAVVGGPGPASTPPAVAIESSDGWTTVRLLDAQADPQAVVDELEAAGIDARAVSRTDAGARNAQGFAVYVLDEHPAGDPDPADLGLSLSVSLPDPFPAFDDPTLEGPAFQAALDQRFEELGVRIEEATAGNLGSVSIRSGSGRTVLVFTD